MNFKKRLSAAAIVLGLSFGMTGATPDHPRKFDEFGDINCNDEMARLDNLAVQLGQEPNVRAVIIFYGGRRFRGRLPKQGEAAARAARLKPYLTERRGIPPGRIEVIDGGYTEDWHVEIWVIPVDASSPSSDHPLSIPIKDIKFQKGKATARQFKCQI